MVLYISFYCVSVSQGSSSLPEIQVFAISYIEDKFSPDNDDISWIKKYVNSCIHNMCSLHSEWVIL